MVGKKMSNCSIFVVLLLLTIQWFTCFVEAGQVEEDQYTYSNSVCKFDSKYGVEWIPNEHILSSCIEITSADDIFENESYVLSEDKNGCYVLSKDIEFNYPIIVDGRVSLILKDGKTLEASFGIEVNEGSQLDIYAQRDGESASRENAIILIYRGITISNQCGGQDSLCSTINIYGGDVYDYEIPSSNFDKGYVNVYGGTVTVYNARGEDMSFPNWNVCDGALIYADHSEEAAVVVGSVSVQSQLHIEANGCKCKEGNNYNEEEGENEPDLDEEGLPICASGTTHGQSGVCKVKGDKEIAENHFCINEHDQIFKTVNNKCNKAYPIDSDTDVVFVLDDNDQYKILKGVPTGDEKKNYNL